MATKSPTRKFAEQALLVERLLDNQGVNGKAGRVIFILDAANKLGSTQKEVVEEMALPKDVVSKLVGLLVRARLLTQQRESGTSRVKRLGTTDRGKQLLSKVTAALKPLRPRKPEPERTYRRLSFFD